jgi:hypothetical protein
LDEWDMLLLLKNDQKASFGVKIYWILTLWLSNSNQRKNIRQDVIGHSKHHVIFFFFFQGFIRLCVLNGDRIYFDFFLFKIIFYIFRSFWCADIKNNFLKIKNLSF